MEGTIGEIRYFAPNFAPQGWAFCQGQLLPIMQNQALYSIVSTIYGGDGKTNFALPDLQGRIPVGTGTLSDTSSVYALAQKGGLESIPLGVTQIPTHTHAFAGTSQTVLAATQAIDGSGDQESPTGNYFSASGPIFNPSPTANVFGGATTAAITAGTVAVQNAGTGAPHENRMPYTCINAIICLVGLYPQRN